MERQKENKDDPGMGNPLFQKPKRKRIPIRKPMPGVIDDPIEFKQNKSSPNARKIFACVESTQMDVWIDQHYHIRQQHGDGNGKREGIDPEIVEKLIRKSLRYLLLYSSAVRGFKFLHHQGSSESPASSRIILKQNLNDEILNVVIETHFSEIDKYEITVRTAMVEDNFRVAIGQYVLELHNDGSTLKRRDNNELRDVCSF